MSSPGRPMSRRLKSLFATALLPVALELQAAGLPQASEAPLLEPLRVVTLNAAHGRSDHFNQMFLSTSRIRENLEAIGRLLTRTGADLVALQEADGPSRWSGRFDHVAELAGHADYDWHFRGDHQHGWLASYGTALLSSLPLAETHSVRFQPTPPSPRKGFVSADIAWPGSAGGHKVQVFSVHFDFLSRQARRQQFDRLARALEQRSTPAIVLGDFNSGWHGDSVVRQLAERTGLQAFEPTSDALATHGDQRLDWILISQELGFLDYEVLADEVVSDHLAVSAVIGWHAADSARPAP